MCGIVGLLVKKPRLRDRLGEWMVPMLIGMTERGPDSSGMAIFGHATRGKGRKFSLYACKIGFDWARLKKDASDVLGGALSMEVRANHAVLQSEADPDAVRKWLAGKFSDVHLLSVGRSINLYKDTGLPQEVADRYNFVEMRGTHVVAHTRMATESAVTPAHAHPFTAGEDFCLVHNGSLSNPYSIRRKLERLGMHFDTDNDSEAACRFLEYRMREGDTLEAAIEKGFDEFDGFYTFLMATEDKLALVRDAFSCKPAVIAESDDYVAVATEFRSLAHLPGIKNAKVFEPKPQEIFVWST